MRYLDTNPVRTSLVFNGTDFDVVQCREEDIDKWKTATDEERKELAVLYEKELLSKANKKSFTAYVWGCWCTAYARLMLYKAIKLCGHKFVYCDTDSVKYVGNVDFSELNAEIQAMSEKHGAYADDPSGKRHYLGVYECESKNPGEPTYKRFCTLGAKKYAYEDIQGNLHITIAGVSKDGYQELGKLENFKEGFVFTESAGMEAVYNDTWHEPIEIDGHVVEIPQNIYLHKSEYTLGVTQDYRKLFHLSQEQFDRIIKTR